MTVLMKKPSVQHSEKPTYLTGNSIIACVNKKCRLKVVIDESTECLISCTVTQPKTQALFLNFNHI